MELLQRLFKSLSSDTRINILLLLLRKGEMSVSEIANALNCKISTISRNLVILERNYFISSRHLGANVYYRINEDPKWHYNNAILKVLKMRNKEIALSKKSKI